MKISDSKTISQVQKEFSELYPGLKVEFYTSEHDTLETTPSSELIPNDIKIGSIRSQHVVGQLKLAPSMTVQQVESEMKRIYDLNIQIFRKSAHIWLQTSTTDGWTLEKQNRKGLHSINTEIK